MFPTHHFSSYILRRIRKIKLFRKSQDQDEFLCPCDISGLNNFRKSALMVVVEETPY